MLDLRQELGIYDVEVTWEDHLKYKIIKVEVTPYVATKVDIKMEFDENRKERIVEIEYEKPVLKEEMRNMIEYNKRRHKLISELINRNTFLTGKVTDKDSGEEMIGANIIVKKNDNFIQGETTDIDGNFKIRVDPGTYDIEVSYMGYPTEKMEGIIANANKETNVDVKIKIGEGIITDFIGGCGGWRIPLIKQDQTTTGQKITSEQIKNLPTRNIKRISIITPGVSFSQ